MNSLQLSGSDLLDISFADLHQDFEELTYIVQSSLRYLNQAGRALESSENKYIYRNIHRSYEICGKILNQLMIICRHKKTLANYQKLVAEKSRLYNLIRQKQTVLGSLITSTDFQSPSYLYSLNSQAGRQTGKIIGTINDYKRDVHLDESILEKKFIREYIDSKLKILVHAYLVNSGLAAFTTILTFLFSEGKLNGNILLGKSSYFQYKHILIKSLADNIIEFSEFDTRGISELIRLKQPRAIFVDSLCNAKQIPVVDLEKMIDFLNRYSRSEVYLIVDNTGLSVFCQPFSIPRNKNVHFISFESLNKYVQFGLDRVTAGIIIARWKDGHRIFDYRKDAGTNISDNSVYALPIPNRRLIERRLLRHQRNAYFLSSYLQNYIDNNANTRIEQIIYPKLRNYPGYQWTQDMQFTGSYFNIRFKEKWENTNNRNKFIRNVINIANRNGVDINAGTSFGLNTSRVYLTSLWTDFGDPFIRISAGTEDLLSVTKLVKVLLEAIKN